MTVYERQPGSELLALALGDRTDGMDDPEGALAAIKVLLQPTVGDLIHPHSR